MQARFLLGPAGSGKTFRCLAEIRQALRESPDGPPLLLLTPKQATFQLERQLLADGSLGGYTRLQILSFERLARLVLTEFAPASVEWLDDEGRVMVLRALLAQKHSELRLFHASARLPGFATRLGLLLRELQRHQVSPERLLALSAKIPESQQLRDKLHDFAVLLRGYRAWLKAHNLQDADGILDAATEILREHSALPAPHVFHLAALWLDGFAEMTAQELDLLSALVPLSERSTLAFCIEAEPRVESPALSSWSVVSETFARCRERLAQLPGAQVVVETISRDPRRNRFAQTRDLARLEELWAAKTIPDSSFTIDGSSLRFSSCANPESEAVLAAREVRQFVRGGGRFREAAVLVRSLDSYADTLRRVFDRYEIHYFLDQREPVAHHPLAELTRYALRTAAFNWRQSDWFGAVKTGFVPARETDVDWLENVALEFGWEGETWQQPLSIPANQSLAERAERIRQQIISPFATLAKQTAAPLNGIQLANVLREFWEALDVEKTLERWTASLEKNSALHTPRSALHSTILDQMHAWLENLERAFASEAMPLRDWLPVLEAGLANLSVGVIPPALDQVLIGTIDRSRNPDLKLAIVSGLNEGIFPAPPVENPLLTEAERDALLSHHTKLGPTARQRVGHEWFYGYIACTRASQRLVLTCAQVDSGGNKLNRSPFFDRLEKIFPNLKLEIWQPPPAFSAVEHLSEIIAPAIQLQVSEEAASAMEILRLPELADVLNKARSVAAAATNQQLSEAAVEALYGRELATSVSGLEDYAACAFKFFISRGLRAQERKRFELDPRERGSFQHEVLTQFHNELAGEDLKWRDISPDDVQARVQRIGRKLLADYRPGIFTADGARRFSGEMLLASLETLIAVLVGWARDYHFDPHLVETGFGLRDSPWPAWKLDASHGRVLSLRGRIDRVDILRDDASGAALAVVMDYKSSGKKPDRLKLYHGLQLQLPSYLAVLEQLPEIRAGLGVSSLAPVGVFYVNLRGEFSAAKTRGEALEDSAIALRRGFQHIGRYDGQFLHRLDPKSSGEQFRSGPRAGDRMEPAAFRELLNRTVENLRRFGTEIFSGRIAPEPYRKGSETACSFCEYVSVCRFDSWTQPFRTLKKPPEVEQ